MNAEAVREKPPGHPRQHTILIVDDDPSVREVIGRVLAAEGYQVQAASNGNEALEFAAHSRIDLVLLDLNMPAPDGWDTFERLTSIDPQLAVIVITARSNQLFTSLAAGVGALLEKPLDFPVLLRTIANLLAETAEERMARFIGRSRNFVYLPSTGKAPS